MTTPAPPTDAARTVAFHTLGCRTNQLETSTLADDFRQAGWAILPTLDDPAQLVVLNTCTVTERADLEALRLIRRVRLSNPEARIAVTGCYAQMAPETLAEQPGVAYVFGNGFKDRIRQLIEETPAPETPLVRVTELDKSRILQGASHAAPNRTRGSLKIQDGCDYQCTYCIIWQARGKSRSLPVADLQTHVARMVEEGFREIGLTGINIGQYDCPETGADLAGLLRALAPIAEAGGCRIRLTSLDPLEVTPALIQTVADLQGVLCPHIHLSAQSAEDRVLKRMSRRHHVADFIRVCEGLAEAVPDVCIGSDIIVGFPGETDEAFEHTARVLAEVPLHTLHVFSYSKRPGTPAADFPDQVPGRVIRERAHRLMALSEAKHAAFRARFVGRTLPVLLEHRPDGEPWQGLTPNYLRVALDEPAEAADDLAANQVIFVQVTGLNDDHLVGRNVTADGP